MSVIHQLKDRISWHTLGDLHLINPRIYKIGIYATQLAELGTTLEKFDWESVINNAPRYGITTVPPSTNFSGLLPYNDEDHPIYCTAEEHLFGSTAELLFWHHINGYETGHVYICNVRLPALAPSASLFASTSKCAFINY